MRGKRRNRATWFPIVPTTYGENPEGVTWYEQQLSFDGAANGDTQIIAFPLTLDDTLPQGAGAISNASSLSDYVQGQDYLLQRVVGKVWMGILGDPDLQSPALVEGIGCIALAVLPSDQNGAPSIPAEEYNPLFSRNAQQPWIWRRTWRLDNPSSYTDLDPGTGAPPGYTGYYGSIQEGGHLDAKSRRRVVREHRLYIIGAMGRINGFGSPPNPTTWYFGYDLRVLGTMRRGKNKSSF